MIYSLRPGCLLALLAILYTTVSCLCQGVNLIRLLQKGEKKKPQTLHTKPCKASSRKPRRGWFSARPPSDLGPVLVPIITESSKDERPSAASLQLEPGVQLAPAAAAGPVFQRRHVKAIKRK